MVNFYIFFFHFLFVAPARWNIQLLNDLKCPEMKCQVWKKKKKTLEVTAQTDVVSTRYPTLYYLFISDISIGSNKTIQGRIFNAWGVAEERPQKYILKGRVMPFFNFKFSSGEQKGGFKKLQKFVLAPPPPHR